MVVLADDDDLPPRGLGLGDKSLDVLHVRARRADDLRAACLQLLQHLPALAVGADEHRLPRCRLPGRRDQTHPLALQLRDDIGVVDNAPEHRAAMRLGRFVRERDRALHAVAEACGLSKNDPHSGAPPTA